MGVRVPVVQVRRVGMVVDEALVAMGMRVRLVGREPGRVIVPVVLVVPMFVVVLELVVGVGMAVLLPQQDGDPEGHHRHADEIHPSRDLVEDRDRGRRADERRDGEVDRVRAAPMARIANVASTRLRP